MDQNVFREFVERYGPLAGEEGPVLFAREVFGVTLDAWQEGALRAYGRGERRISVRACHGVGKTFLAAVMIWHTLLCRFPQHTVVTAPSKSQLYGALKKTVDSLYEDLPDALRDLFEVQKDKISLKAAPAKSMLEVRTARAENPEALQGVHCDGGYVLLVADEASGVPERIYEAAAGSMSGENATTLLLSNPVRSSGFFFDTHHGLRDMWFTVHVSAGDSPRVSDDFVTDIARRYGERSNAYRIRVLGEFPLADQDSAIPYELVDAARNRDIVLRPGMRTVWGLDVARFGDDANALVKRSGMAVLHADSWEGVDLMQTTGRVKQEWDQTPASERPIGIFVDVIGLGAGVVDRLRELGLPVRAVNVSESPGSTERFLRMRDELWWTAREWFEARECVVPQVCVEPECSSCKKGGKSSDCLHERLVKELTTPQYQVIDSTGKIRIEPKSVMKKRGHMSPNLADAFVMTFAEGASVLAHGSSGSTWAEPIKRNRAMV